MGPAAYQQPSGDSLPLAGSGGRRPEATHPHEAVPSGPRAGCPPPHPHGRTGSAGAWAAHGKGHTTHLAGEPALGRAEPAARLRAPVKVAAVVLRGPELLAHGVHDPHVLLPGLRAHRGGVTAHLGDSRDVAERRCRTLSRSRALRGPGSRQSPVPGDSGFAGRGRPTLGSVSGPMRCSIGHSPAGKRLELWAPAPHRAPPPPPPSPPALATAAQERTGSGQAREPHRIAPPTPPALLPT